MPRLNSATDMERLRQEVLAQVDGKRIVSVTNGTDGRTRHSDAVVRAFVDELRKQGLADKVIVKSTGCHGFCEKEPSAVIFPEEICYVSLKPEDVPEIVSETLAEGKVIERLLYEDPTTGQKITKEPQMSGHRGLCDRLRMVHSDVITERQVATGIGGAEPVEISTETT